jgi:serine/threonine protein kinase
MSSPAKSPHSNSLWSTLEGQVVDGRYHLDHLLSSGSYGGVFAADEVVADKMMRRVAIKLITPDPEYPERQMEELVLATSMDHPNILRCFSPGACSLNGIRLLYIIMELASSSLADRFVDAVLTPEETRPLTEGILSALIYLGGGEKPMVHRDIKPANILYFNGVWKLADFGLLRGIGPERVHQTRTLLGTAEYAPPEAFDGTVSTAWDMWSLGAVIVEALTGALPFDEASPQELQNAILNASAQNVDHLPEPYESIVRGCLLKERLRRWTAEEALGFLRGTAPAPMFPSHASGDKHNLKIRKAKYPFRFKYASADNIPELLDLCEEYPFEAQDYLTNRYFAKWFGDAMDDPALSREASGFIRLHWHEPERAVELFVRELRRSIGLPFDPQMISGQKRLDFGLLSTGEQATKTLHYTCAAKRHVWGTTQIVGELPGVTSDRTFGVADAPIAVRVNLIDVNPGHYEGMMLVHPEGLADSLSIPISYTVTPLRVRVSPSEIAFGAVEHGLIASRNIEIVTSSPNVEVRGCATIVPPSPGISIEPQFSGANVTVVVTADCTQLEAGREYVRRILLETSAGNFQIPLRLRVLTPFRPIAQNVAIGAVIGGLVVGFVRSVIDTAGAVPNHWFLVYPSGTGYHTAFRLVGSPVVAVLTGYLYRSFVRWRWPLTHEQQANQQGNQPFTITSFMNLFRNDPR